MNSIVSVPRSPWLHERLDAYAAARNFYRLSKAIRDQLPRGLGEVSDQLKRAASSVSLAIAEGACARARGIKAAHFQRALASAGECAAALDQIEDEGGAPAPMLAEAREHLRRCSLLTLGLLR